MSVITVGWVVRLEQSDQRRCDATTRAGSQCSAHGRYGYNLGRYCYRHHPDWEAWYEEARRIEAIAQAAIRERPRGPLAKAEGR